MLYPGKTIDISRIPREFLSIELSELARCYGDSAESSAHAADEQSSEVNAFSGKDSNEDCQLSPSVNASDFEQIIELSNAITILPDEGVPTRDLLNNLEANLIRTALEQTEGNVSKASELLQLGRTSLIQKINKYQLGSDS